MLLSTRQFDFLRNCGFILFFFMCLLSFSCSQKENSDANQTSTSESIHQTPPLSFHGPAWSPDGSRIAFASNMNGNNEIYTISPDGTNLRQLTDSEYSKGEPCWSPDGKQIAFASNQDGPNAIYKMSLDSLIPTRLTDSVRATAPEWSPDGKRICYEGRINGNNDIFTMNSDGTAIRRMTNHEANDFGPHWSPNGSKIVFNSKRSGSYDLYLMDADGSNIVRLTTDTVLAETRPNWTEDGEKILFVSTAVNEGKEISQGLYLLDLASKEQTQVTDGAELEPCWSPDGNRIAYIEGNGLALFVMNSDGSNQRKLLPAEGGAN